jgi:Spy/CpxP family protein refolding chaperone
MTSHIAWVVAVLLLVPASGRAAGLDATCERDQAPQRGAQPQAAKPDNKDDKKADDKPGPRPERPKWWIEPKLRAELGITDQQSALVEQVWQKSAPALREGREKLNKLEEVLSKLTEGTDEAAVIAQSETVEKLRAELNKGRTLMLYRIDRILKPDQRAKVKAMYHPDQGRRGPSSDKPSSDKK